jgi:transposase
MEWVACVGLDWGDKQHAYLVEGREGGRQSGVLDTAPEGIQEWIRELRRHYPNGTIIIGVEQGRRSLIYALSNFDSIVVVPINPRASERYRESQRLSRASSDESDAELICRFVLRHLETLPVWKADDAVTRELRGLTECRRTFVDQRTAFCHQLAATLKDYFPQALQWFGGECSTLLWAMIARWPSLEELRSATAKQLVDVLRSKRCRKVATRAEELLGKILLAQTLITDVVQIRTHSLYAQSLVAIIEPLNVQIEKYDRAIAAVWKFHPDHDLFDSLPGVGPVLGPRLAAAFGRDRSRYTSAFEMECYSGIAPVIEQSGKQRWVHARWSFPTFLHQTFHEFAQSSIPKSRWANAVYHEQRARGAHHHEAIRALAFRWIRILFRIWKSGERYDEQRHIDMLIAKQSPIAKLLAA